MLDSSAGPYCRTGIPWRRNVRASEEAHCRTPLAPGSVRSRSAPTRVTTMGSVGAVQFGSLSMPRGSIVASMFSAAKSSRARARTSCWVSPIGIRVSISTVQVSATTLVEVPPVTVPTLMVTWSKTAPMPGPYPSRSSTATFDSWMSWRSSSGGWGTIAHNCWSARMARAANRFALRPWIGCRLPCPGFTPQGHPKQITSFIPSLLPDGGVFAFRGLGHHAAVFPGQHTLVEQPVRPSLPAGFFVGHRHEREFPRERYFEAPQKHKDMDESGQAGFHVARTASTEVSVDDVTRERRG